MDKKEYEIQKALGTLSLWRRIEEGEFEFVEREEKEVPVSRVRMTIGIKVDAATMKRVKKVLADTDCTLSRVIVFSYFKHLLDEEKTKKNRQKAVSRIIQHARTHEDILDTYKIESH